MLVKTYILCVIKNIPNKIKNIPNKIKNIPKSFNKDRSSLKKIFPEIVIKTNPIPVRDGYAVLKGILLSDCKK